MDDVAETSFMNCDWSYQLLITAN